MMVNRWLQRYQDLERTRSRYILRNRFWQQYTRAVGLLNDNGDPVFDNDSGQPVRSWRWGIRSYTDYCELGDLNGLVDQDNYTPAGTQDHRYVLLLQFLTVQVRQFCLLNS